MSTLKNIILSNSWLTNLAMYFRRKYLRKKFNIRSHKTSFIGFSVICEGNNRFYRNSTVASCHIGFATYIGVNNHFQKAKIGRYSSIGPDVKCIFGKHPSNTFVSTHPSFYSLNPPVDLKLTEEQLFEEFAHPKDASGKYSIIIGNDVWIGANVSIMDGVTIGDGAIVAANALVNKDVAPYTIVGGVPAKAIKMRFKEEEIEFLTELKWWDKSEEWIKTHAPLFRDISILKNHILNGL